MCRNATSASARVRCARWRTLRRAPTSSCPRSPRSVWACRWPLMSADSAGSRHDRYRERLAALATDLSPLEAIVEVGRWSGLWAADRRWVRAVGRLHPAHGALVSLVFKTVGEPQLLCCVDVFATRPVVSERA